MQNITATQLATWLEDKTIERPFLLDVREPWEFQTCHIDGSISMPMGSISDELSELNAKLPIVCICHHGIRSRQVGLFLEQNNFNQIINLTGGVHAWAEQVDESMPTY